MKVALVTGGGKGIGRAISSILISSGCDVVSTYIHAKSDPLPGDWDKCFHVARRDVSKPNDCKKIIETIRKQFGRLDILVNNAGIWNPLGIRNPDFHAWSTKYKRTFAVNFFGPVNLTYFAVPLLAEQKDSRIVNIASRAAFRGQAFSSDYAASKAALVNFTRSIAVELASIPISVFAVAPSWVDTDMVRGLTEESMVKDVPLKRIATPKDVAKVVEFLALGDAEYLTGTTIDVNGASYFH